MDGQGAIEQLNSDGMGEMQYSRMYDERIFRAPHIQLMTSNHQLQFLSNKFFRISEVKNIKIPNVRKNPILPAKPPLFNDFNDKRGTKN